MLSPEVIPGPRLPASIPSDSQGTGMLAGSWATQQAAKVTWNIPVPSRDLAVSLGMVHLLKVLWAFNRPVSYHLEVGFTYMGSSTNRLFLVFGVIVPSGSGLARGAESCPASLCI